MRAITCSECGATIQTRSARKTTCSTACAKLRAKKRRLGRTPGRRDEQGRWLVKCEVCAGEFPAVAGRKTCSDDCETARKRRRWRAYWHSLSAAQKAAHQAAQRARHAADPEKVRAMWRRQDRRQRERSPIPPTTCDVCGREFQGQRKDSRFCSEECRATIVRGPASEPIQFVRACDVCRLKFRGRRNQKYCGLECRREGVAQKKRRARREVAIADDIALAGLAIALERSTGKYLLTCQECGKQFRSDSALKQVCSRECHQAKWTKRRRLKAAPRTVLPPIPCKICGTEFTPIRRSAASCSEWCRAEDKRIRMRERAKRPEMRQRLKILLRKRKGTHCVCVVCGRDMSDMDDLKKNRYTCSPECRREALRRKQRRTYERRTGTAQAHQGLDHDTD